MGNKKPVRRALLGAPSVSVGDEIGMRMIAKPVKNKGIIKSRQWRRRGARGNKVTTINQLIGPTTVSRQEQTPRRRGGAVIRIG